MLRRIGFRRLLPLIQLPLYVVLVLYSYPMYVRIAGIPVLFRSRHVAYQELEGVPFNPQYIERPMPLPLKVAVVLNLPAVLVGMMPLHFVPNQERTIKQEFYAHLATSVLVAVLWFVVGLWLDRQLGFVVRRRCSRSLVRRVLRWSVLVIGAASFSAAILATIWEVVRRGWSQELLLIVGGLSFWPGLMVLVTRLNIRRARSEAATLRS